MENKENEVNIQLREKRVEFEEFPEDREERFAAFLVSFNAGPKAITYLLLPPYGYYISPQDLTEEFRQAVAGTEMENTSTETAPGYCHKTLRPNGLVVEEYLDFFGVKKLVGFGQTEGGKVYGPPAACLQVYFEFKNKFSLYPILGGTNTPSSEGKSAPYIRAKILQLLAQKTSPIREVDIQKELGIGRQQAGDSLEALKKAGVIDYEAVTRTGEVQVGYKLGELPPIRIKQYKTLISLTQQVAGTCQELGSSGIEITQTAVFEKLPKEVAMRWKEKKLRAAINSILSNLARQSFLLRGKFKGGETLSVAEINEKGRIVVEESLNPLMNWAADKPQVREWLETEIVPEVRRNFYQHAQNSAELYFPHSKGSKIRESQHNKARVKSLISQRPGITIRDLSEQIRLNRVTIGGYLSSLRPSGEIRVEERKGVYYFYPISPEIGS